MTVTLARRPDEAAEMARTAELRESLNGDARLIYGGAPGLVHIANGKRSTAGERAADFVEEMMRRHAEGLTDEEREAFTLCPGCYMVVIVNMALSLAARSGQSFKELGRSLSIAFGEFGDKDTTPDLIEEVCVILDRD